MAQVWRCDRCRVISDLGDIDDPPDGWRNYTMPFRGSEGAKSTMDYVLCVDCEDGLYWWLNDAPESGRPQ